MTKTYDWQGSVGENWAAEWRRTDRSLAELNEALVSRVAAAAAPDARILDIGCGAGATSFALAERLPGADIVGIDLSEALLSAAKARNAGGHVRFELQDAASWDGGEWRPDILVSRHGVMFFDEPVAAFAHFAQVAAPGARLVFSCFDDRRANEWATEVAALLPVPPAPAEPHAPGPFAFADPEHVRALLEKAGWKDAKAESLKFRYVAGAGDDPVADAIAFFSRIGPAAPAIRSLDPDQRSVFFDQFSQLLCNHLVSGAVLFQAAAWIWSAHR